MACDCEEEEVQTVVYDWPDAFAGKSFSGFDITATDDTGFATLTDVVIRFHGTPDFSDAAVLTLTVGDGLTITSDEDPWVISVDDIAELSLPAGVYFYQMVTDEQGIGEWPYMTGKWRVKPSI